jgi:hypothetical protein
LLGGGIRCAVQAQTATETIGFECEGTDYFRQSSRTKAAIHLHLPETFLGMDVALGEVEVIFIVCINMGNAIVVGNDLDWFVQTLQLELAAPLCKWFACE